MGKGKGGVWEDGKGKGKGKVYGRMGRITGGEREGEGVWGGREGKKFDEGKK